MKSPEERGPIGAWAYEARVEHDLSVEQVIERLPTRYHPATLRKVESGSAQPGRRMLRELAALYGSSPEPLQATETPAGLQVIAEAFTAAIDRQTAAIVAAIESQDRPLRELLVEIALYRQQQAGMVEALIQGLGGSASPSDDPEDAPLVNHRP